jgi:hypothetical protein
MTERVRVIVEAEDAASGVLRGLLGELGAFGGLIEELTAKNISWGNVAQMATQMIADGLKDAIKTTLDYANNVRMLSQVTGQSAEEMSRVIQVADDFKISTDQLKASLRAMTKEGLTPNMETLAQLSDEYLKLNPGQERAEFLLKKFGRAGVDFAEMMGKGSDALLAMNDAVDESLILNQQAVDAARQYEITIDNLTDSWTALKVEVGNAVIPVLTSTIDWVNAESAALQASDAAVREYMATYSYWERDMNEINRIRSETYRKTFDEVSAQQELQKQLAVTSVEYENQNTSIVTVTASFEQQIGTIMNLQNEYDSFNKKNADIQTQIQKVNADFAAGNITLEEQQAKLTELNGKLAENQAAHEQWAKQTVFSMLQVRLAADGLSKEEFDFLIKVGEDMGLIDEETAKMASGLNAAMDSIDLTKPEEFKDLWEDIIDLPHDQQFTITTDIVTNGELPDGSTPLGGGRASGGDVYAGTAYTVGEMGREMFVPSQDGTIIPSNQLSLNNFYGPVTLAISDDGGAGIMGVR